MPPIRAARRRYRTVPILAPFALPPELTGRRQSIDVARGPAELNDDNNRQPVGRPSSDKTTLTAPNILGRTDDRRI